MSILIRSLALILLLASVLFIAPLAISDFYYDQAKASFNVVQEGSHDKESVYNSIFEKLNKSLRWRKANVEALDLKARVFYQSWWFYPDGQYIHQSKKLQSAIDLHKLELTIRRDWSYSAAQLALIYSHQPTINDDFSYWFAESYRLGRYEAGIARSMMNVGFIKWAELNDEQKLQMIEFVRLSIEQKSNSSAYMRVVLDEYNKRSYMCEKLDRTPRVSAICN